MALNRFSIFNRLNSEKIDQICFDLNISFMDFYNGTQTKDINFELCAYLCQLLGFKDWYPKYHPKGMGAGKEEGWGRYKDKNKEQKRQKRARAKNS